MIPRNKAPFAFILVLLAALAFCSGAFCFAQSASKPIWLVFEEGKQHYSRKEFGEALQSFENAIRQREESIIRAMDKLLYAQKSPLVKKAGDSIKLLLAEFAKLDFTDVDYGNYRKQSAGNEQVLISLLKKQRLSDYHRALLDALEVAYMYRPVDYFADSLARLERELKVLQYYPEAEFWKGKVFMVEGELAIAEKQFLRAFDMRGSLEIPEDQYLILYTLSEVYSLQKNTLGWYNTIQRILLDDPVAGTPPMDPYLKEAMIMTLRKQGFDKFMVLYRLTAGFSLRANREMGRYLLRNNRSNGELHCAIAANMIMTQAIAMYQKRNPDYIYASIGDFLERMTQNREIADYLLASELYEILLNLGDYLFTLGQREYALSVWTAVAQSGPLPWKGTAAARLANPSSALIKE